MGTSLGILLIVFIIFFIFSDKSIFVSKKSKNEIKIENKTISEIAMQDTDLDGILDWGESLWGTYKNNKKSFNDLPDATYISNKKKEMNIQETKQTQEELTETDKFAREFFASYMALKDSGQVDSQTINNFSNALGQKIVNQELINKYAEKDLKISNTEEKEDQKTYYNAMKKVFEKYKNDGIGTEMNVVASNLTRNEDPKELILISMAYKNFAEEALKITVPRSLSTYHLKIINNSYNTGISIGSMQNLSKDPLVGLSGLSQYQKYSEDFVRAVEELEKAIL